MHSSQPGDSGRVEPSLLPRSAPFTDEPGYFEAARLWLYGNIKLLDRELCFAPTVLNPSDDEHRDMASAELESERLVLEGKVLVCGVHNDVHRRAAIVPLRWGAPRIVVLSGGFHHHLGPKLDQEPFRVARLWRYQWDPKTDLAISKRAPDRPPTFARHNPTVDRLIRAIAEGKLPGLELFTANRPLQGEALHRMVIHLTRSAR